jgi:hypothetical protein
MKKRKPQRNSHYPGDFWYYNNWDFNVLGHIYNKLSGSDIYNDLAILAKQLDMQDFQI